MAACVLVFPRDIAGFAADDPTELDPYDAGIEQILARYGGRYLRLRTHPIEILEGDWRPPLGMGILELPSMERARAFWDSDAYAPLKAWRMARGRFDVILVDGMPDGATLRERELARRARARQTEGKGTRHGPTGRP